VEKGALTTEKGEIREAMVIADLIKQGHDIAIPFGHNLPFLHNLSFGQQKGIRWAPEFTELVGDPMQVPSGSTGPAHLPFDIPPE
jgi:hypothetical protein